MLLINVRYLLIIYFLYKKIYRWTETSFQCVIILEFFDKNSFVKTKIHFIILCIVLFP